MRQRAFKVETHRMKFEDKLEIFSITLKNEIFITIIETFLNLNYQSGEMRI